MTDISELESMVQKGLHPDLTLILDLPVEEGLARAGRRGELDRFEKESRDFFIAVQKIYHHRALQNPDRIKIIDASVSIPEVQLQIASILSEALLEES